VIVIVLDQLLMTIISMLLIVWAHEQVEGDEAPRGASHHLVPSFCFRRMCQ